MVKLQFRDLSTTGTTVGRLSAYGTAGAIVGTFLTGFVLVAWAAVTTLVVAVGLLLVASGIGLWLFGHRRSPGEVLGASVSRRCRSSASSRSTRPCETQTVYYCVAVVDDPDERLAAAPSCSTICATAMSTSTIRRICGSGTSSESSTGSR